MLGLFFFISSETWLVKLGNELFFGNVIMNLASID